MQDDISGWSEWQAAFAAIPELASPSELHGLLMGIIAVALPPSSDQWQQILEKLDVEALSPEALALLTEEGEDVAAALADDSLDYMPMLPDDQHPLEECVQALADWCSGVVLGFGLASGHIRADEAELLEDLQDVASVEFDATDDDEEGEESYADLLEFVRLIPVSLSTGRKKQDLAESSLFNSQSAGQTSTASTPQTEKQDNVSVVEMFTPGRPS